MLALWPTPVRADQDRAQAQQLYERANEAYDKGRYAEAARLLLQADQRSPNDVTLAAALDAAAMGDDPSVALDAAERAHSRGGPDLIDKADHLRQQFADRVGRILVRCPAGKPCLARIDNVAVPTDRPVPQTVGKHYVERTVAGQIALDAVEVKARGLHEVSGWPEDSVNSDRPPAARSPASGRDGIAPAWFLIGLGATVAAGAGTVISGLDTRERHAAFRSDPSLEARDDGRAAQLRTNVLLGITGVCAGTTAVLALFTDWGSDNGQRAAVRIGPSSVAAALPF
jgi:hypothetical protein